ncbi:hypothetical protein [Roseibium limicola]|uniref:Uncharacterized protein n=1 Tax=Roseibium limicola TaxID=2816037 RepID=A0A939EPE4_9HYPH|nr:hypothetical protein [Roseibium limicola]MBO0345617.1 hypothetical protein [Roseibium limicola]
MAIPTPLKQLRSNSQNNNFTGLQKPQKTANKNYYPQAKINQPKKSGRRLAMQKSPSILRHLKAAINRF